MHGDESSGLASCLLGLIFPRFSFSKGMCMRLLSMGWQPRSQIRAQKDYFVSLLIPLAPEEPPPAETSRPGALSLGSLDMRLSEADVRERESEL